ncbi:MAG: TetR family transcriptional regulator [Propionibacteriales bacterium]|nr:TetR family transcriptional regulator [Propionibacteriales bacterium]
MTTAPRPATERVRPDVGLRERKKLRAMRHIQEVALDLFDEHGYAAVTIERVAAEAEVSPSSIYRYFGTKEQLVLYDEYDPMILDMIDKEPAEVDPMEAIRRSISYIAKEILPGDEELIRRRMRYAWNEPAVRSGLVRQVEEAEAMIREGLARRTGKDGGDLELKVVSAALVGGFVAVLEYWHQTDYRDSLDAVLERAFDVLSGGLKLE